MHAQLAARHRAEETQEAFRDILSWSKKQKDKDRALAKAAASRRSLGLAGIDDLIPRSVGNYQKVCKRICKIPGWCKLANHTKAAFAHP